MINRLGAATLRSKPALRRLVVRGCYRGRGRSARLRGTATSLPELRLDAEVIRLRRRNDPKPSLWHRSPHRLRLPAWTPTPGCPVSAATGPASPALHQGAGPPAQDDLVGVASLPASAVYAAERGGSLDTRSACWHALVPMLLASNVNELVIERLAGLEARDEGDVGDALRKADMVGALSYRHETHRAEPILRLADAVAWATGAKRDWQRRVARILRAQR